MRRRTTRGGAGGAGKRTDDSRRIAGLVPVLAWVAGLSFGIPQVAAAQPETAAGPPAETEPAAAEEAVVAVEAETPAVVAAEAEPEAESAGEAGPVVESGATVDAGPAVEPVAIGEVEAAVEPAAIGEVEAAVEPAVVGEVEASEEPVAGAEPETATEPEATPEAASEATPALAVAEAGDGAVDDAAVDWANVDVSARLYTVWQLTDELDNPGNEFALNSMRVQAEWQPVDWAAAVLELEAEQLVQAGTADGLLRDAYVELSPFRWLEVRAGQFKRPFSRSELTSRRNLRTVNRGALNRWAVGRLGYGDRDIGLGLSGRLWKAARLDYAVGVFNGNGAGMVESGGQGFKDFSARLEARPVDWLSFGLSFSLNTLEDGDLVHLIDPAIFAEVDDPVSYPGGYNEIDFRLEHDWLVGTSWMTGADAMVRVAALRLQVEAVLGENWWFEGAPLTSAVALVASYEFVLSEEWGVGLEPVFRGELVLPRIAQLDQRMWRATAGVNLLLGKYVRLMVDGEFTRVEGAQPDTVARGGLWPGEWPGDWENVNCLLVQLALDV